MLSAGKYLYRSSEIDCLLRRDASLHSADALVGCTSPFVYFPAAMARATQAPVLKQPCSK